MNERQQRRAEKKTQKPKVSKSVKKEDKKPHLTQLSAIMKGIVEYRTNVDEMCRLIRKYPDEAARLNVACGAYP